jgi:HJR/Mrr/RecB family endonuclease
LILLENLVLFIADIFNLIFKLWYVWSIIALFLALSLAYFINKDRRLSRSGIEDVDTKVVDDFEEKVETVLKKLGFKVSWSRISSDHGFNIVASMDGVKFFVQAIQNQGSVGVKALQEAIKAKDYNECDQIIVVTNKRFSARAVDFASQTGVVLWNRDDLISIMFDTGEEEPSVTKPIPYANDAKHVKTIEEFIEENCDVCDEAANEEEKLACLERLKKIGGELYCQGKDKEKGK